VSAGKRPLSGHRRADSRSSGVSANASDSRQHRGGPWRQARAGRGHHDFRIPAVVARCKLRCQTRRPHAQHSPNIFTIASQGASALEMAPKVRPVVALYEQRKHAGCTAAPMAVAHAFGRQKRIRPSATAPYAAGVREKDSTLTRISHYSFAVGGGRPK
jgi:hypothetical protein